MKSLKKYKPCNIELSRKPSQVFYERYVFESNTKRWLTTSIICHRISIFEKPSQKFLELISKKFRRKYVNYVSYTDKLYLRESIRTIRVVKFKQNIYDKPLVERYICSNQAVGISFQKEF